MIPKVLQRQEFGFVLLGKWDEWGRSEKVDGKLKIVERKTFLPKDYGELIKEKIWKPLGKAPFEFQWEKKPYKYNDPKLIQHLKEGKNYGVIGGYGNLRMLDIDDKSKVEYFKDFFKDTFMVQTGSGGLHIYFISEYATNHVLKEDLGNKAN